MEQLPLVTTLTKRDLTTKLVQFYERASDSHQASWKSFSCFKCFWEFGSEAELAAHMKTTHPKNKKKVVPAMNLLLAAPYWEEYLERGFYKGFVDRIYPLDENGKGTYFSYTSSLATPKMTRRWKHILSRQPQPDYDIALKTFFMLFLDNEQNKWNCLFCPHTTPVFRAPSLPVMCARVLMHLEKHLRFGEVAGEAGKSFWQVPAPFCDVLKGVIENEWQILNSQTEYPFDELRRGADEALGSGENGRTYLYHVALDREHCHALKLPHNYWGLCKFCACAVSTSEEGCRHFERDHGRKLKPTASEFALWRGDRTPPLVDRILAYTSIQEGDKPVMWAWQCQVPGCDLEGPRSHCESPWLWHMRAYALYHLEKAHAGLFSEEFYDYEWRVVHSETPHRQGTYDWRAQGGQIPKDIADPNGFVLRCYGILDTLFEGYICKRCLYIAPDCAPFIQHISDRHGFCGDALTLTPGASLQRAVPRTERPPKEKLKPGWQARLACDLYPPNELLGKRDLWKVLAEKYITIQSQTVVDSFDAPDDKLQDTVLPADRNTSVNTSLNNSLNSSRKRVHFGSGSDEDEASDAKKPKLMVEVFEDPILIGSESSDSSQGTLLDTTEAKFKSPKITQLAKKPTKKPVARLEETDDEIFEGLNEKADEKDAARLKMMKAAAVYDFPEIASDELRRQRSHMRIHNTYTWEGAPPPKLSADAMIVQNAILTGKTCPKCRGRGGLKAPDKQEFLLAHMLLNHAGANYAEEIIDNYRYAYSQKTFGEDGPPLPFQLDTMNSDPGQLICSACPSLRRTYKGLGVLKKHWSACTLKVDPALPVSRKVSTSEVSAEEAATNAPPQPVEEEQQRSDLEPEDADAELSAFESPKKQSPRNVDRPQSQTESMRGSPLSNDGATQETFVTPKKKNQKIDLPQSPTESQRGSPVFDDGDQSTSTTPSQSKSRTRRSTSVQSQGPTTPVRRNRSDTPARSPRKSPGKARGGARSRENSQARGKRAQTPAKRTLTKDYTCTFCNKSTGNHTECGLLLHLIGHHYDDDKGREAARELGKKLDAEEGFPFVDVNGSFERSAKAAGPVFQCSVCTDYQSTHLSYFVMHTHKHL